MIQYGHILSEKDMPPKRKSVIGYKNNRLTVIADAPDKGRFREVKCSCECGKETTVRLTHVKNGNTTSCGCAYVEGNTGKNKTHGLSCSNFYAVWKTLWNRCNNPKVEKYRIYGGRGIKCLWRNFEEFRDDMYADYLTHKASGVYGTTIDRINVNGDYCKENCRWATFKEQANNKRKKYV